MTQTNATAPGRPAAGLLTLRRQYVITDGWAVTVRRLVRQADHGYPARTQARVGSIRLAPVPAARLSPASAACAASSSRSLRQTAKASTTARSESGSTCMIAVSRSAVSGLGSVVSKQFTPTTLSWPDSIRARR